MRTWSQYKYHYSIVLLVNRFNVAIISWRLVTNTTLYWNNFSSIFTMGCTLNESHINTYNWRLFQSNCTYDTFYFSKSNRSKSISFPPYCFCFSATDLSAFNLKKRRPYEMQMFRKYSTYKYFLSNTPYTTFNADAFGNKKKKNKISIK